MKIKDFKNEIDETCKKTYLVGFINEEGDEDETEFDVTGEEELSEVYQDFCGENNISDDTVFYVEETIGE